MRSGRLASVPARNGAPGLRPHAGQERAFAESDGLGEAMPRTVVPTAEVVKVALHGIGAGMSEHDETPRVGTAVS